MSEENPGDSFFKEMIQEMVEKDPKMAFQMMYAAFKLPTLIEFISSHKEDLDAKMNVTMSAGEALFLFGACLNAIGSLGSDASTRNDGQLHIHALREYMNVGMTFAKLVETIGYPEDSAVSGMAGAMATVDGAFEQARDIHSRAMSGELKFSGLDDLVNREVQ